MKIHHDRHGQFANEARELGINKKKMRTISEKYANSSKYYMIDTGSISTETITVPIGFRLFANAQSYIIGNIRLSGTGS